MFALYELYLAIKADKTVVFYHQPSDTTSVFDKLTNRAFKATPDDVLSYLDEEDTVYLYDAGTKSQAQYRSYSGRILVFSSPERKNYAEVLKKPGTIILYMPTWSWSEICLVIRKTKISLTMAQEMFNKFGGVACYIFIEESTRITQMNQMLDELIASLVVSPDFLLNPWASINCGIPSSLTPHCT